MLRPRLRIRANALRTALFRRSEHTVPILDQFRQDKAVPGLLSPAGYSTAWTMYMQHITDKLNTMTAGTDYEHQTPLTILKAAARDPAQAAVFNYASMAHNNHFFFNQLLNLQTVYDQTAAESGAQLESSEERIPQKLRGDLKKTFSSIGTLRREFLSTALAMFGPGFVWLVKNANTQDLRILTTYLAGSPYTAAHWRRQGVDFNTAAADRGTVSAYYERTQAGAGNIAGRYGSQAPGGADVIPLLCLNTWEHVWLTDYGVTGKGEYVQQWWETIDWEKVESLVYPNRQFR
ncbi:manganese and iron superoxide dismutase [Xylaria palmicola]|nr:manganese and iron superoxide dismutase [Xylaria palmicola]